MIDIQVIKLSDFIHDVGEDEARSRLSSFSCGGLNDEVEHYLCDGAFRHSRKKTSVTYLMMAAGDAKTCFAYYTLAVKPFSVKSSRLTARQKKADRVHRRDDRPDGRRAHRDDGRDGEDFVLADKDVFACPVTDIRKTKVVSTWFEGERVYQAK